MNCRILGVLDLDTSVPANGKERRAVSGLFSKQAGSPLTYTHSSGSVKNQGFWGLTRCLCLLLAAGEKIYKISALDGKAGGAVKLCPAHKGKPKSFGDPFRL